MSRFILVHGAWLGAWCWDDVVAPLRAQGHEAIAIELPGHGADQTPLSAISLAAYVDRVSSQVAGGKERSVLVGHSMAGIVLSSVAEAMPEKLHSLIYVAAYLLRSGQSIMNASAIAADSLVGPSMVPAADWSTVAIKPEALAAVFAEDAPAAALKRLQSLARPEPAQPFSTPLTVTAGRFGTVRRCYVRTALDRAVTPMLQDAMLAAMPCAKVATMATSHTPFLAKPNELADTLMALAST